MFFKLKQYYTAEEYLDLENKFQQLENRFRATRSDFEDAQKKLEGNSTKSVGVLAERPVVENDQPSNVNPIDSSIVKPEKKLNVKELMEKNNISNDELNKYLEFFSCLNLVSLNKFSNTFYREDRLTNVDIPESKMKEFLDKNKSILELVTNEHIKKMEWHKNNG